MKIFGVSLLCVGLCVGAWAGEKGSHLFILSGQSNMAGLDPQLSFIPAVEQAFGKDRVLVVKDALGGQPIRRWDKGWDTPIQGKDFLGGDLYKRLMIKVSMTIRGQQIDSVTFVWMQGERDARESLAGVYGASFKRVVEQLKADLKVKNVNVVIGRLSDFDMGNTRYPHWTKIREVQERLAKDFPRGAWVDTDDLNDGVNKKGKAIKNDLHYAAEGYKTLGQRFADEAIRLVRKGSAP